MARIMGIDYGAARCGVSVTDPLQIAVHPLKTVANKELEAFLTNYITEEEVIKIVFGKPVKPDGSPANIWPAIESFITKLSTRFPNLEVDYQDESYSSKAAQQVMIDSGMKKSKRKIKGNLDLISAVIILQRYLRHI